MSDHARGVVDLYIETSLNRPAMGMTLNDPFREAVRLTS